MINFGNSLEFIESIISKNPLINLKNDEAEIIRKINLLKLKIYLKRDSVSQQELLKLYNEAYAKLYSPDHKVEKGDRLI